MVIIELTYQKPLSEVDQYLDDHRSFLDACYAKNIFIASGPKNPRDGGVILAHGSVAEINKIIISDKFYTEGIAHYRMIEFTPTKMSDAFCNINEKN